MPAPVQSAAMEFPESSAASERRVIYPYSVIPGGVRNRTELSREISRDPVVAAHYQNFNTYQARVVRVQEAQFVHVSYRLDEKIYWTARKVKLPEGEQLITDGRSYARARCGNRVAVVPQEPVSEEEPPAESFDAPIPMEEPELPALDVPELGEPLLRFDLLPPPMPPLPALVDPIELPSPREWPLRYTIPIIPPIPPAIITPPESFSGIPEPGTLLLVGSGFAALYVFRRSRIRR